MSENTVMSENNLTISSAVRSGFELFSLDPFAGGTGMQVLTLQSILEGGDSTQIYPSRVPKSAVKMMCA